MCGVELNKDGGKTHHAYLCVSPVSIHITFSQLQLHCVRLVDEREHVVSVNNLVGAHSLNLLSKYLLPNKLVCVFSRSQNLLFHHRLLVD